MGEKTEHNWSERVVNMLATINNTHPELAKYLNEMPVTLPDLKNPKLDDLAMKAYYDSLCVLLKNYSLEHP